jgi:dynactin complex subunit
MTSKLPVRSADDIDETALSYAEIKALATGNLLIIEKCQLEMDVSKLKLLHASHLSQKYALEDKILKEYPLEIKRLTERIGGYTADIETVKQNTPADKETFPPMKIGGILYDEKAKAGTAILDTCKSMISPHPIPLGEYRGFSMELSFDTFTKEYMIKLQGKLSHEVRLGSDVHGNITRIDNALEGMEQKRTNCETNLDNIKVQLEAAKGEQDRPFAQEQEYSEKSARLKEVNVLLNMDEKDHELLDAEPDEGDPAPQRKTPDRGR